MIKMSKFTTVAVTESIKDRFDKAHAKFIGDGEKILSQSDFLEELLDLYEAMES